MHVEKAYDAAVFDAPEADGAVEAGAVPVVAAPPAPVVPMFATPGPPLPPQPAASAPRQASRTASAAAPTRRSRRFEEVSVRIAVGIVVASRRGPGGRPYHQE
jgi:hypothetical protein